MRIRFKINKKLAKDRMFMSSKIETRIIRAMSFGLVCGIWWSMGFIVMAQLPGSLPWAGSVNNGRTIILQPGIAAVTCGVTTDVAASQRWTFGLINVDGVIPATGRLEVTAQMYHHPSWHVDQLGNVYGVAVNERTGDIFVTASANYGGRFKFRLAILQYGSIGGGANSLQAAGTVYRLDAVTGQATVFARLPQQSTTLVHVDCEVFGTPTVNRTTGVGLGNIVYDEFHDQYFVTNMEDGRIYRLDTSGNILDSYDPGIYDNGAAGVTNMEDLPYGLAVEPGGGRLFYGGIDVQPNNSTGAPSIFSINLNGNGSFTGTVNNAVLPAGATYDNYVGTEQFHLTIQVTGGTFLNLGEEVFSISDMEFLPNGQLMAGVRIGCEGRLFSSYNHAGETDIIAPNGSGIYNILIEELDVSLTDGAGAEDGMAA